jgi:hypothetical protein
MCCKNVSIFCHSKIHMNCPYFKRSLVIEDYFLGPKCDLLIQVLLYKCDLLIQV